MSSISTAPTAEHETAPPPPAIALQEGEVLVGLFPKNASGDFIAGTLARYRRRHYVSLRVWSADSDGVLQPRQGVCLYVGLLAELRSLVEALEAAVARECA